LAVTGEAQVVSVLAREKESSLGKVLDVMSGRVCDITTA
ncbi:unnamed protein product, partial [Allacma fusca]